MDSGGYSSRCPTVLFSAFLEREEKPSIIRLTFEMGELFTLLLEASLLSEQGKEQEIFFLSVMLPLKTCSLLTARSGQDVGGVNRLHKALNAVICSAFFF